MWRSAGNDQICGQLSSFAACGRRQLSQSSSRNVAIYRPTALRRIWSPPGSCFWGPHNRWRPQYHPISTGRWPDIKSLRISFFCCASPFFRPFLLGALHFLAAQLPAHRRRAIQKVCQWPPHEKRHFVPQLGEIAPLLAQTDEISDNLLLFFSCQSSRSETITWQSEPLAVRRLTASTRTQKSKDGAFRELSKPPNPLGVTTQSFETQETKVEPLRRRRIGSGAPTNLPICGRSRLFFSWIRWNISSVPSCQTEEMKKFPLSKPAI